LILSQIGQVLAAEAPITRNLLSKLVLNAWGIARMGKICEKMDSLYEFLRRTKVINRGKMEATQIAVELNSCNQALCIVNGKKHAIEIYSKLSGEGVFHLSTRMCPKHRSKVLDEIKQRLKNEQLCKVVSTQLIEAGVDVDFPLVY